MNRIEQFGREPNARKTKLTVLAGPETPVQHFPVRSESAQKTRNETLSLDMTICLLRLKFLVQDFRLPDESPVTGLKRLISALNAEMSPTTNWGWRYIYQVGFKEMPPSKKLQRAIYLLYMKRTLKGVIPLEQVTVLAPVGYVQTNSTLRIRSTQCARTACPINFIPSRSNHIYCCRECGRQSRGEKRNNIIRRRNG